LLQEREQTIAIGWRRLSSNLLLFVLAVIAAAAKSSLPVLGGKYLAATQTNGEGLEEMDASIHASC
jgi:hypothetical protein